MIAPGDTTFSILAYRFSIVGTLPGAFRHSQRGFVDAYVMFRTLETVTQVAELEFDW